MPDFVITISVKNREISSINWTDIARLQPDITAEEIKEYTIEYLKQTEMILKNKC